MIGFLKMFCNKESCKVCLLLGHRAEAIKAAGVVMGWRSPGFCTLSITAYRSVSTCMLEAMPEPCQARRVEGREGELQGHPGRTEKIPILEKRCSSCLAPAFHALSAVAGISTEGTSTDAGTNRGSCGLWGFFNFVFPGAQCSANSLPCTGTRAACFPEKGAAR